MTRAVAALLLVPVLVACGGHPEATDLWEAALIRKVKERGKLVVALEAEFKPFEYRNDAGEIVGFDVDLARAIAKELGVEVELRDVKFDTIIAELMSGKADLIVSGMTTTPERALSVNYTEPYFHTITALLVSKSRAADVKDLADVDRDGRIVTVKLGTTGEQAAKKSVRKAQVVSYPTENAAALEVALGRADAFLYDLASVRNHHAEHRETTFLLEEPITYEPYAIAVRKGDPVSIAWLNLVLGLMRGDGRMKEMYERHGLVDPGSAR
jgi:polar amino acid transport system substrate-binding protein